MAYPEPINAQTARRDLWWILRLRDDPSLIWMVEMSGRSFMGLLQIALNEQVPSSALGPDGQPVGTELVSDGTFGVQTYRRLWAWLVAHQRRADADFITLEWNAIQRGQRPVSAWAITGWSLRIVTDALLARETRSFGEAMLWVPVQPQTPLLPLDTASPRPTETPLVSHGYVPASQIRSLLTSDPQHQFVYLPSISTNHVVFTQLPSGQLANAWDVATDDLLRELRATASSTEGSSPGSADHSSPQPSDNEPPRADTSTPTPSDSISLSEGTDRTPIVPAPVVHITLVSQEIPAATPMSVVPRGAVIAVVAGTALMVAVLWTVMRRTSHSATVR